MYERKLTMSEKMIVSVADFGAIAGSEEFQEKAIQNAIDHVFLAGGGEVQVPAGVYRVRGLRVRSNIVFHLLENAVLEGSRDPDDYFILKDDMPPVKESEMVREANRILKNNIIGGYFSDTEKTEEKKKGLSKVSCFLLGALLSFILCTLLFLIII